MGCDIEFAIYYTLFITCIIKTHMEYIPITLPFTIRRKTKYAVRKMDIQKGEIVIKKVYSSAMYFFSSIQQSSTHCIHLFTKSIYTDLEREELVFTFVQFSSNLRSL